MSRPLQQFYLDLLTSGLCSDRDSQRLGERVRRGRLLREDDALSHVCVMVVVFNPESRTVLLVNHKKAGSWIFPGGHVDAGELPEAAAIRELKEELRLTAAAESLVGPVGLQVLDIDSPPQRCREHYDLFYALASQPEDIDVNMNEFSGLEWLAVDDARSRITSGYYREALERFLAFVGW